MGRKLMLVSLTVIAVVMGYCLLTEVFEWLRVKAGVGSDTCTPIDILAWQACLFYTDVIAGCLARGLWRSAGLASLLGMLVILGMCLVLPLDDSGCGSLVMDGFAVEFKGLALPVIIWTISSGLAVGWALSNHRDKQRKVLPAIAALVGGLISLALVFYPTDLYFMSIWG